MDKWVCRSQRKAGTGRFLRIATAYVMHDGLRYTVAMKIVGPGQRLEDIVAWLIQSVRRAGIGVRRYRLDRGFAGGAVPALAQKLSAMHDLDRAVLTLACKEWWMVEASRLAVDAILGGRLRGAGSN